MVKVTPSVDRWSSWLVAVDICGVQLSWTDDDDTAAADRPAGAAGTGMAAMLIRAVAQGEKTTAPPAAPVGVM